MASTLMIWSYEYVLSPNRAESWEMATLASADGAREACGRSHLTLRSQLGIINVRVVKHVEGDEITIF